MPSVAETNTTNAPPLSATRSYTQILTAMIVAAVLAMLPFRAEFSSQVRGFPQPGPLGQTVVILVDIALSYAIIRAGLSLGRRVDLGWPPIDGWHGQWSSRTQVRRTVVTALLLGALMAICMAVAIVILSPQWHMRVDLKMTVGASALASVGAGIYEEVWYRLGAMTIFAWMLTRLSVFAHFPRTAVWTANALAAALFAAAHIPQTKAVALLTPSLTAFVLLGNGALGLVCGWLYWRRGLFAAMIAHSTVDLILKVGLPLANIGA